jgi:hypothetical protein
VPDLVGRRLERSHHMRIAIAERVDADPRIEIEIGGALGIE